MWLHFFLYSLAQLVHHYHKPAGIATLSTDNPLLSAMDAAEPSLSPWLGLLLVPPHA